MRKFLKKLRQTPLFTNPYIRMVIAIISLIIGILGLLLPIAPGIPFILLGIYLINPVWYRKIYQKIKNRFKPPESKK